MRVSGASAMVSTARNGVRPSLVRLGTAGSTTPATGVEQERQQHQQHQHGGQMLAPVPEVVFQLVALQSAP